MNRVTQAVKGGWVILTGLVAISFVSWLYHYFGLSFLEILTLLMVLAIGIVIYLFVVAGGHLGTIEKKIDNGFSNLRNQLTSGLPQARPKQAIPQILTMVRRRNPKNQRESPLAAERLPV